MNNAFYDAAAAGAVEKARIIASQQTAPETCEKCEGCNSPATTRDADGIRLCQKCAEACDSPPTL